MTYKLTTKSNKIEVDLTRTQLTTTLARTGGQGSAGRSIISAEVTVGNRLILTMSDGTVIDAGAVPNSASLADVAFTGSLSDLKTGTLDEGTIIGGYYGN